MFSLPFKKLSGRKRENVNDCYPPILPLIILSFYSTLGNFCR